MGPSRGGRGRGGGERRGGGWGQEAAGSDSSPLVPPEPHFVQALPYGPYVYFFFREVAVELSALGKVGTGMWWHRGWGHLGAHPPGIKAGETPVSPSLGCLAGCWRPPGCCCLWVLVGAHGCQPKVPMALAAQVMVPMPMGPWVLMSVAPWELTPMGAWMLTLESPRVLIPVGAHARTSMGAQVPMPVGPRVLMPTGAGAGGGGAGGAGVPQ